MFLFDPCSLILLLLSLSFESGYWLFFLDVGCSFVLWAKVLGEQIVVLWMVDICRNAFLSCSNWRLGGWTKERERNKD